MRGHRDRVSGSGHVYLVGAGPGDPGLLTLRAVTLLGTADVIVHDRLGPVDLSAFHRPGARLVDVGKASGQHKMAQSDINALLVREALAGHSVVRLKGGDPFVFGRGAEEAAACAEAGVPFSVVPGVTSAIAVPAYAGIPVTERSCASSFAVVTGHLRSEVSAAAGRSAAAAEVRRDWERIAAGADTLVFLMGVEALPEIARRLTDHGRPASTPCALIQDGSLPTQRVVVATLETVVSQAEAHNVAPPAVLVVGDVVMLRSKIRWFDDTRRNPLFGKRIVVTRARHQASTLSRMLQDRGAVPLEVPMIRIETDDCADAVQAALRDAATYSWVCLTSVNGVDALAAGLEALDSDIRLFGHARFAVIGPATAEHLRTRLGIRADVQPKEAVAEALVAEWLPQLDKSDRVVLFRADGARDVIPNTLNGHGIAATAVAAYRTDAAADPDCVRDTLANSHVDAITFTSSSTVHNFVEAMDKSAEGLRERLGPAVIAAIGPVTAATASEHGLGPDIVAPVHTINGLVESLEEYYAARSV